MRSSVGAEMMIMVIMMMGDDQDMGLDPGQRRSVFSPQCVQKIDVQHCVQCVYGSCTLRRQGTMRSVQSVTAGRQRGEEPRVT